MRAGPRGLVFEGECLRMIGRWAGLGTWVGDGGGRWGWEVEVRFSGGMLDCLVDRRVVIKRKWHQVQGGMVCLHNDLQITPYSDHHVPCQVGRGLCR